MYKGIFWIFISVNGREQRYHIVPVKVLCDLDGKTHGEAVYSSKSGRNFNHKKEWEKISRIIPGCKNKPYDYLPRGRVEIDSRIIKVFANPLIIEDDILHRLVVDEFDLTMFENNIKWIADNSNHYRYLSEEINT